MASLIQGTSHHSDLIGLCRSWWLKESPCFCSKRQKRASLRWRWPSWRAATEDKGAWFWALTMICPAENYWLSETGHWAWQSWPMILWSRFYNQITPFLSEFTASKQLSSTVFTSYSMTGWPDWLCCWWGLRIISAAGQVQGKQAQSDSGNMQPLVTGRSRSKMRLTLYEEPYQYCYPALLAPSAGFEKLSNLKGAFYLLPNVKNVEMKGYTNVTAILEEVEWL